jgi:hypothetical protein
MSDEWDNDRLRRLDREQAERDTWRRQEERAEGNKWIDYELRMKYWVRHGGKMPENPDKP